MRVIRAGEHIQHIPGWGMSVRESGVAVAAAANWWEVTGKTCVAAYQPKGAASLAASYSNLANPGTNNAAPGVAPDWNATDGWVFNGTDDWLTTGIPSTATLTSVVRYVNGTATTARGILGTYSTLGVRRHAIGVDDADMCYWWASLQNYTWGTPASGIAALSGQTTSGVCYKDGSALGTLSTSWGAGGYGIIFLGAVSGGASVYTNILTYFDGSIQAVAIYAEGLDATEVGTLGTAMAAL